MTYKSKLNERSTYNERKPPNLYRQQYNDVLKQKFYLLSKDPDKDTLSLLSQVQSKLLQLDRQATDQSDKSIVNYK